jgi:protein phosphatase
MITEIFENVAQFSKEEIESLLSRIQPLLRKEPLLTNLPKTPLLFIGDTHGDWEATKALLSRYWDSSTTFVFLGDYVDRGPNQIENMNLLFELKTKAPNRLIILRGNHEIPSINRYYGFYDAVQAHLGNLMKAYWNTFAHLPLAAISREHKIFAVHGGIPEGLDQIEEIRQLPREVEPEHPVTFQLLWNDPKETLKGFAPSLRGGRARNFGLDVTVEFMNRNNIDLIIRAHEVFHHGFHEFFDGRILSLFSCRNYRGPIAGKALYVSPVGERDLIPI